MKPLKYDDVRRILPSLEELRPVLDALMAGSTPDPNHRWAASGELETVTAYAVEGESIVPQAVQLAEAATAHLASLYAMIGEALACLSRDDASGAAGRLLDASALEEEGGRFDRAEAYAAAAHRTLTAGDNPGLMSRALRRWGRAARACGRLDDARVRYEEGFEVAQAISDPRGAAEAAIGVGNVLEQQGRWAPSIEWYERALAELTALDEPVPERWHAQLNIHIALRSAGAFDESLPWLQRAEREAAAVGDEHAAPFLENAWGQLHAFSGDFDAAAARFRTGLVAATSPAARVTLRLNLSEALLAQARLLEAGEEAREAEREALMGRALNKLPEVYRMLGRVASAAGNPDAFVLFERSLELGRERGLPVLEQAMTLQAYAEAEEARGEREVADDLLRQARDHYETLGIAEVRHPWTDVYGVGDAAQGGTET